MNCLPGAICVMNVDHILHTLSSEDVDYLLIGGMNFLLRHLPELTFDVDIWVRDDSENLERLNGALRILSGEWGQTETDWRPVPQDWRWLRQQGCYCLTTTHGAVDIFREVRGLEGRYGECKAQAIPSTTSTGVPYYALSDEHMLACQQALPPAEQKQRRMEVLTAAINRKKPS